MMGDCIVRPVVLCPARAARFRNSHGAMRRAVRFLWIGYSQTASAEVSKIPIFKNKPFFGNLIDRIFSDQNILYILAVSVFLPYVFTVVILFCLTAFILIHPQTRGRIFCHKGAKWLFPFFAVAFGGAIAYHNWIGLIAGIGMFCIFTLGLFARSAFTVRTYEHMLHIICMISIPIGMIAFLERIVLQLRHPELDSFRCTSVFFNANYFATIAATVVIICAYKVGSRQGSRMGYFGIALLNMLSAYLSGSLFVWVEIFIGVALVFFLLRKHEMLSGLLLGGGLFCFILYFAPGLLLPRLTESPLTTERRVDIWRTAIHAFLDTPLFGRGPMTYYHCYADYPGSFPTTHAHNIYLDPLLSYGIVGTIFLVLFAMSYLRPLVHCLRSRPDEKISVLLCAVIAAAAIHGITDLTLLWVQTGLLFMLILGGLNLCERRAARSPQHRGENSAPTSPPPAQTDSGDLSRYL